MSATIRVMIIEVLPVWRRNSVVTAQTAYQGALQHAKTTELKGAIQDVKDALSKQPNSPALKQAATLLQDALPRVATTP